MAKGKNKAVWGIDIGGTYTKVGLVTEEGEILASKEFRTGAREPFSVFMENLEREIKGLKSEVTELPEIVAIGVGAPNANSLTGNIEYPPNLKWGDIIPLVKSIEKVFDLPVTIANDANAAALGHLKFGPAKEMRNFVALTLGTGLGSGIIVNGKLLLGAHAMAAELGHVNVDPNGRHCNCGLQGCLETYASVTGIKRTVFELLADMTEDSPLRGVSFDEMTGIMIADAALEGDPVALEAFERTGFTLGNKMADIAAHLDPEAIILSGGLSKAGDILLNPTIASMEHNLFNAYRNKIKVLIYNAPSTHSVLGPAALALS
ncbi:ROK family protein [Ulvibacterium sp.]|uniref:ROK family protein n=1 Tax=Ulvibacterium sp. TaxID=2665914 RepID=UPI003BAA94DB